MKNLVRFVGILAVAVLATAQANASVLVSDTFTYPDGALPAPWAVYSGSGMNVLSGQATVTGALTGDFGLTIPGTHTSYQLFAGFDATVISWAPSGASTYFALLKDS